MKIRFHPVAVFVIGLAFLSVFYLSDVSQVPFHPDESTQLFTSSDAERFWQNPSTLFWRPDGESNVMQRYRELDAPLTRNIIALGRWIGGQPALPRDWDWGGTWEENQQQGSLPSPELLLAGRLAVAALFPFSVFFLYLAARKISNETTAWMAALLLASNALVLLHTRRAMAEGVLIFATTLFMLSMVQPEKRSWLSSIAAALAFCAKQSLAPLALVSLIATTWSNRPQEQSRSMPGWSSFARRLSAWGAAFVIVIAIFHPFVWERPLPAIQAAIRARQALASAQIADRPGQALDTPLKKLVGMIGSLYVTPPAFSETTNYSAETRAAEEAYLENPLHSLLRSLPAGGLLLMLNLFGFGIACRNLFTADALLRRRLLLLLSATALQTIVLLVMVPLAWQRYYLPIVPFACLWIAYGVNQFIRLSFARSDASDPTHRAAHLPEK